MIPKFLRSMLLVTVITSCSILSPPLTIETINKDGISDENGVPDIEIGVFDEGSEMQFHEFTDEKGIVKFAQVKNNEFRVTVSGDGVFFPVDTLVSLKSLKSPLILQLEEIKTILIGSVFEDSTFRGVDSCVISTIPATVQTMTNTEGQFVLKSKKFTNTPYTIQAMHDEYNNGSTKSVRLTLNQKNLIPAIMMAPIKRAEDPTITQPTPPETPVGSGVMIRR